jgi:hypothetical protein
MSGCRFKTRARLGGEYVVLVAIVQKAIRNGVDVAVTVNIMANNSYEFLKRHVNS